MTGVEFSGPIGSVTWTDSTIGLDGCGGYAQARAFVRVKVTAGGGTTQIQVRGPPFSLG